MEVDSASYLFPTDSPFAGLPRMAKRDNAEHYILLLLVGFPGSILATRTFLELTGYPQIASGDFHIAHVLWGGLLLAAAIFLMARRPHWGLLIGQVAVQWLMPYFNQFDVILTNLLQFSLLLGILRYRARRLPS